MASDIQPNDFREALEMARARKILPTHLGSADLRELSAEMRRRSLFSARVTNAQLLQELADQIEELMQGKTNLATAMMDLRSVLDELDYTPEAGFPGDAARGIPPAEKYDLRDISSHKRLSLMLETNQAQAYGEGRRQAGNQPSAVSQFPAWELIRISPRRVPRGFTSTKTGLMPLPGDSWPERFVRAGGRVTEDGRMIARKDAEVWERLGDSNLFPDGLDQPFPPFAFSSGMDWRAVPRSEAIDLGIIGPDELPVPEDGVRFTDGYSACTVCSPTRAALAGRSRIGDRATASASDSADPASGASTTAGNDEYLDTCRKRCSACKRLNPRSGFLVNILLF